MIERTFMSSRAMRWLFSESKPASATTVLTLARRQLWYLVVQREAIGLRDHEGLYRYYRIPAELKVFAGPRRSS